MNSTLRGVVYVSVWVMLWGTAASLADFVLLQRGAYEGGTAAQAVTFASYGIAAVVLAVRLSRRFLIPPASEAEAAGEAEAGGDVPAEKPLR
jgi:hypothetical protein